MGVGVKAAGDDPVDYGLLLLLQQRDEPPLGGDVPPQPPIHVVQIPDDGALLRERRNRKAKTPYNANSDSIVGTSGGQDEGVLD